MKVEFTPEFEKSLKRLIWRERLEPINPFEYGRRVKWFLQRGKRGYSDRDLWGFDYYLCEIMPKALRQLNDIRHGYPDSPFAKTGMTDKKWGRILEQMAVGFEAYGETLNDHEHMGNSSWYKKRIKRWEVGSKLFIKYFGALWD